MARRIAIAGAVLVALLGAPRRSEAGLLEIIWGMSGPQMIGAAYGCLYELKGFKIDQCRVGATPIARPADPFQGKWFVSLGASLLVSTSKDSETQPYGWGEIWLIAAEPGIAYRSFDYEDAKNSEKVVEIHHGVGVSYNRLFGRDIRPFSKVGIVVTPIDVRIKKLSFGVRLRLYPNGFTDDEFKPVPRISRNRPFEATIGFAGSYVFDREKK